jgi:hypothetical protein
MDGSPRPGFQPSWKAFVDANSDKINDWKTLGLIGESYDLIWGGRWTDPVDTPHFQYTKGLLSIESTFHIYATEGLPGVWQRLI